MKSLLTASLAFLAFSALANATPAVGDQVTFEGTFDGQPAWQGLAFTEYNAQNKQYKKVTVTRMGSDQPQSAEEWVNADDAASDAALQAMVNNCPAYNGTSERVSVPAGTFLTCKLPMEEGGYVWIGQVPFAVVRIETPVQGKMLVAWLTGYTRGQ